MINSFQIKNFRQIKSLEFEALGRVNLITGKNNTGKTSMLEALHIYAGQGGMMYLPELLVYRNEDFNSTETKSKSTFFNVDLETFLGFFHAYELVFEDKNAVKIGTDNELLTLKFLEYYIENGKKVYQKRTNGSYTTSPQGMSLSVNINSNDIRIDISQNNKLTLSRFSKQIDQYSSCFVHHRISDKLDEYWDSITLTPQETKVIDALRIIEPKIDGFNLINGEGKKRKGIIKLNDGTRHPLGRMGDGINRILAIILALVNAENGFLLIDEFENGLHFSVQEKLWEVIFKTAEQLNVQVFATTHSNDCVSAFAKIQQELEYSDTKLFRMFLNKNGEVRHREFTSEDLSIALEQNIEIRN